MGALPSGYPRRALWISGRSSRLEWWIIEGFVVAAYAGWDAANGLLFKLGIADWPTRFAILLALFAPVFWLNVASSVRRLHDRNRSGWWVLPYAFPLLGQLWQFIECGFLPPRDASNRFDPAPDTNHLPGASPLTVQRLRPPRPFRTVGVTVAVLVAIALVSVLATSRIRITEVGPHDRLPGDFARDPDER
jgi:uncharacterized membrane protein YhaH (DUF805 family)